MQGPAGPGRMITECGGKEAFGERLPVSSQTERGVKGIPGRRHCCEQRPRGKKHERAAVAWVATVSATGPIPPNLWLLPSNPGTEKQLSPASPRGL